MEKVAVILEFIFLDNVQYHRKSWITLPNLPSVVTVWVYYSAGLVLFEIRIYEAVWELIVQFM